MTVINELTIIRDKLNICTHAETKQYNTHALVGSPDFEVNLNALDYNYLKEISTLYALKIVLTDIPCCKICISYF